MTAGGLTERYTDAADGNRVRVVRGGVTRYAISGLWEETVGGPTRRTYLLTSEPPAQEEAPALGTGWRTPGRRVYLSF